MNKTQARNRAILGIGILFVLSLVFSPVTALTENELEHVLNSYTYGREYEVNVWDCSDMSINVAWFLQERLGYDTLVMYYKNHAWVLVSDEEGAWMAVETTADCVNRLGVITYEDSYYYGYYGEWNKVRIS